MKKIVLHYTLLSETCAIFSQAGTEVGCVVLYDTTGGQLMYIKRFDSQESRLSMLLKY